MSNKATVKIYNGSSWQSVTGNIHREYPKGLTIEDERGVIHYATFDRVQQQQTDEELCATLF